MPTKIKQLKDGSNAIVHHSTGRPSGHRSSFGWKFGAHKDQATNDGRTPLFIAARKNHLDVVRLLVADGAHKDQATNYGATPLCIAAQEGHLDVVRHLVEVGAHKDQATNDGATPLFIAAQETAMLMSFVIWWKLVPHKDQATNDGATPLFTAAARRLY